jgi:hypothetical protein
VENLFRVEGGCSVDADAPTGDEVDDQRTQPAAFLQVAP